VPRLKDAFPGVPCCFDTDVNAPAVAEAHEDPSIQSCCYVTVGTGIGIGVCIGGRPVHGLVHPEGGHMYTPIVESDLKSQFTGVCPFHGCCLEGMASAPSLAARAQKSIHDMKDVADDDPLWDTAAHYYAHACVSMTLMLSPEKIVLGGGVFNRSVLYQKVRAKTQQLLNGYIQHRRLLTDEINSYIVEPKYGPDAGIQGARFLAQQALLQSSPLQ
jgi:fructokinase